MENKNNLLPLWVLISSICSIFIYLYIIQINSSDNFGTYPVFSSIILGIIFYFLASVIRIGFNKSCYYTKG